MARKPAPPTRIVVVELNEICPLLAVETLRELRAMRRAKQAANQPANETTSQSISEPAAREAA